LAKAASAASAAVRPVEIADDDRVDLRIERLDARYRAVD
jgi:hypothetical protein